MEDCKMRQSIRAFDLPEGFTCLRHRSGWWYPQKKNSSDLFAVQWTNGDVHKIRLSHGIDRIEQMGDAAVVGTDGADLHFSAVSLRGSPEEMVDYVRKGASQGSAVPRGQRQNGFRKPERRTLILGTPRRAPPQGGSLASPFGREMSFSGTLKATVAFMNCRNRI
jgi:hypothetical protein